MANEVIQRPKRNRGLRSTTILLVFLLLVVAGFGVFSFRAWRKAVADNPITTQNDIMRTVGDLAITPDETPQIATVHDAAKLTSSVLAHTARNDDVLLIYRQAGRIIVYRPSAHKIVDILNIESTTGTKTDSNAKK